MNMDVEISPSMMCADLLCLADEMRALDAVAGSYHVDIIDWHYCKNMSLAPCFIDAMRKVTDKPVEAHLYVDNIDEVLIDTCLSSGATTITMPPDVIGRSVYRFARRIHEKGARFGVFLSPSASLSSILPYVDELDRLLVMTVDPGFAGQQFVDATLDKIVEASQLRSERNLHFDIEVDGCCNERFYERLIRAGADVLVLGSSGLFSKSESTEEAARIARKNVRDACRRAASR